MLICSIHLILLIAKLNNLEIYQADVGNAYLEAHTKEKMYSYFIAGKEFATFRMECCILIRSRAFLGYVQVINDFMKFSQTCFTWKNSHGAKLIQMSGCDATVILMNM